MIWHKVCYLYFIPRLSEMVRTLLHTPSWFRFDWFGRICEEEVF